MADSAEQRRTDTSYLDGALGYVLRCAQLAVFRDVSAVFADVPITIGQFSALAVIQDNPGISQAALAAALQVDRPRIVPVLDAMERQGWTVRKTGESDRRVRRLHLTAEGEAVLADLQHRFAAHQYRMLQRLDGVDAEVLMKALRQLAGV
jgi:DNA-binding MarR family transcriptional regulator